MRTRWGRGGVGSAVLALLLAATLANAGELVRDGFEDVAARGRSGQAPGRDGDGWTQTETAFFMDPPVYLEHAVSFADGRRGSISFDLQRTAVEVKGERTVFALHDAAGQVLFRIKLRWGTLFNDNLPLLRLRGRAFVEKGLGLWSTEVLLDREVAVGQWVHFDLTWDDAKGRYGLYVDGRTQDVEPHRYVFATGERLPDNRPELNAIYAARGEPQRFSARPFGDLLRRAETLRLGATYITGTERASSPLANAVLDNFVVVVDESAELVTKLHRESYDVNDLAGTHTPEGIRLTWNPPEIHGVNQGYLVYRRAGEDGNARFEKLTAERVYDLTYLDATAQPGETYRYSVTAVYADGRGRDLESQHPPEVTVTAAALSVASVAAEKATYGANQEIVVTLRGTKDGTATFTLDGIAADQPMEEIDDGVYVGKAAVPSGLNLASAALTATLTDAQNQTASATGAPLTIDSEPPEAIDKILATAPWGGEIEVAWDPSPSGDTAHYLVYRGEDQAPDTGADAYESVKGLEFVDTGVVAGIEYHYLVVPVDTAGNRGPESDETWVAAVAGEGPEIAAVSVTPFGKPAKPGETLTLTVTGQSGAEVSVEVGTLTTGVPVTEQGRSGTYTGTYLIQEGDVGPTKMLHRLIARMTDLYGSSSLAGPELAVVGVDALNDTTPPVIASAEHDGWQVAGFSGKLVAGDILTVTLEGEPGGYASFEIPGVASGVEMDEVNPGSYSGSCTVGWGDGGADRLVMAKLADEAGNETTVQTGRTLSFDTRVRLTVTARDALLPADKQTTTRLVAKATNANGDDVSGHELALTLSTTEEYTGVVGGGRIEDREARMEDEDNVEIKWGGTTDAFGEVAATYTAGHAAKTALLIAKDLTTGDAGAGWLNTYVSATVAIQLTPRALRGAADRAILKLTVDPPKLTADGRSTARLRAWLTDLNNRPIEGEKIAFSLGNENGRIKILDRETDDKGMAEAEYRAGTAIGTVTVTAAAAEYGVTASVQIILMADAPAKIHLVADATELPADGKSEAALSIQVTDIHDNANAQVPVTFTVLKGSGDVSDPAILTDRNGEGEVTFEAGTQPGNTVIEARHTSRAPTEEELRRVYGTIFVPRLHERQERERIKVKEWLVKPEEEVDRGQELVELASRRGSWTLTAPAKGIFVRRVKYERDRVALGETLGYVEIDEEVWAEEYVE